MPGGERVRHQGCRSCCWFGTNRRTAAGVALSTGAAVLPAPVSDPSGLGWKPGRQWTPVAATQGTWARSRDFFEDEGRCSVGFVPGPGPLSQETSDCVRAGFAVIDHRTVMTAGIEGDPGRAMAGSMTALSVTIACLNDEEWEAAASKTGMQPEEREGMRCLLDQLGGPGEMAEAMKAAGEGDFTDLAGADCGLDMGPATRPGTRNPSSDAHGNRGSAYSCLHARAGNCHVHTGPDRGGAHGDHNHLGDHSRPHPGGHPRI